MDQTNQTNQVYNISLHKVKYGQTLEAPPYKAKAE